jgi:RNA polymerase sigma factor (sigma-70 family)
MAVGTAYAVVGDWQRAQDIAQEAFLEAWLHIQRLENPAAFAGWFRRIVVGKCHRELRRREARVVWAPDSDIIICPGPTADLAVHAAEQRDIVSHALRALPDDERLVAVLHYIGGHTYADVAAFVGIPVTTVDDRLRRSRKRLRRVGTKGLQELLASQRLSRNGGFGMSVRFITQHPETVRIVEDAKRLGETDAPVLVVGEEGTGKVVVARLIHENSPRRDIPLTQTRGLDVDTFEEQVFGSAVENPLLREAEGGALALDFGQCLPRPLQTRLLRLLRSGEYHDDSIGEERRADVRVMALTKRALEEDVRAGAFDPELLAYFEQSTVRVTALRDRPGDIPALTDHFLGTRTPEGRTVPALAPETMEALLHHSWPENVRGLMNAMDHALAVCDGVTSLPDHLPKHVWAA